MVALTGDLVDGSVEHLSDGIAPLGDLDAKDGVYFVTGNHEYYSGARSWCKKMADLGATVLLNAHHLIERGSGRLLIAGVTDYRAGRMLPQHASDPDAAMADAPEHDVRILLAHSPTAAERPSHMGSIFSSVVTPTAGRCSPGTCSGTSLTTSAGAQTASVEAGCM